jgi:hypothetical protein
MVNLFFLRKEVRSVITGIISSLVFGMFMGVIWGVSVSEIKTSFGIFYPLVWVGIGGFADFFLRLLCHYYSLFFLTIGYVFTSLSFVFLRLLFYIDIF